MTKNQDTFSDTDEDVEGAENFPRLLRLEVEQALRGSREQRTKLRQRLLQESIRVKRLLMSRMNNHQGPQQPVTPYASLPTNGDRTTILQSDYAADHDFPLPKCNNHTILGLKRHIASKAALNPALEQGDDDSSSSEDEGPPSPVLGPESISSSEDDSSDDDEDKSPNEVRYARQIKEFRIPHRVGTGTEQDDQEADIKFVLNKVVGSSIDFQQAQRYLAVLIEVEHEVVKSCWLSQHGKPGSANPLMKETKSTYEKVNNTFRSLSCRSCMLFNCNCHGNDGDQRPADVQMEIFRRALHSNHFQKRQSKRPRLVVPPNETLDERNKVVCSTSMPQALNRSDFAAVVDQSRSERLKMSEEEVGICQRLYQIFQGDIGRVSRMRRIPRETLIEQARFGEVELQNRMPDKWFEIGTRKRGKPNWTKNKAMCNAPRPLGKPCSHEEPCSETNCICVQNRYWCTRDCMLGSFSPNFFQGCDCKGACQNSHCPCRSANRECDPRTCGCDACTNPSLELAQSTIIQKCQNDSISMGRHLQLLVGKSDAHGWGCFTATAIKKDTFICEYIGELITHAEVEDRGTKCEEKGECSYIFDVADGFAIDAKFMGNKARFINHSDEPNVGARLKIVNAEHHIEYYALQNIPAEAELFLDYGVKFFKSEKKGDGGP